MGFEPFLSTLARLKKGRPAEQNSPPESRGPLHFRRATRTASPARKTVRWIAFLILVGIASAGVLAADSVFFAPFAGLLFVIALAAVGLETLKGLVSRG
jgi:hypothetical protein